MSISSSNFTSIAIGREAEYGEVPVTESLREVPMTGENFQFSKQSISSQNINKFRQVLDTVQTGSETSGGINIELASKVYDDLIEGALWGVWSESKNLDVTMSLDETTRKITTISGEFSGLVAKQFVGITNFTNVVNNGVFQIESISGDGNEIILMDNGTAFVAEESKANVKLNARMIRNGSSRHSYFVERSHSDLDPRQYFSFVGNLVNSMKVSAQSSSVLTGGFEFMGKTSGIYNDGTKTTDNPNGTGTGSEGSGSKSKDHTILAPIQFKGLNAVSHVGDICINGKPVNVGADAIYMQSLDFNIANNLRGVKAIGVMGNVAVSPGQLLVTGNLNALFASDIMYRRYVSGEEFSLSYSVFDEDGDGYVFSFPRVVVSSSSMNAGGNDQDLVENMQWSAIMDAATETSVQIDAIYGAYA